MVTSKGGIWAMMMAVVRTVQIEIWGMLAVSRAVITIIFMQIRSGTAIFGSHSFLAHNYLYVLRGRLHLKLYHVQ